MKNQKKSKVAEYLREAIVLTGEYFNYMTR